MEQSSRSIVRNLFEFRDLPRVPFVPWVCSLAARLEQVQVEEMLADAGVLSRSLINAQKLFGYDAIANSFDSSLEAEALGCQVDWGDGAMLPVVTSHPLGEGATLDDLDFAGFERRGRVPVVLEATKRIKAIRGKDAAVIGVVTGPLTMAWHIKGDRFISELESDSAEAAKLVSATGNAALKLCRIYCELGVDVVAVAEEIFWKISADRLQPVAAPLRSIRNVARFYNVRSLIVSRCTQAHVEPVIDLQADGVALSGDLDFAQVCEAARQRKTCCGLPVADAVLLAPPSGLDGPEKGVFPVRGTGRFLSTEWDVPADADVNTLHMVVERLHGQSIS